MMLRTFVFLVFAALAAATGGCSSAGIALKEQFGYAKREQLVDRVQDARDGQDAAKKQFESALAEFMAVTGAQGGDLEAKYSSLKTELERSESRAETVRSRIRDTERVADALFKEWNAELAQYSSASLRASSEQQLDQTRRLYGQLMEAMKNAELKMDPVLTAFRDQVLFLKHNLNAQAIASLRGSTADIQTDVSALVRDMEKAIAEANDFITRMKAQET